MSWYIPLEDALNTNQYEQTITNKFNENATLIG